MLLNKTLKITRYRSKVMNAVVRCSEYTHTNTHTHKQRNAVTFVLLRGSNVPQLLRKTSNLPPGTIFFFISSLKKHTVNYSSAEARRDHCLHPVVTVNGHCLLHCG